MACDRTYPLTAPRKSKTATTFEIGLITDLDKESKFETESGHTAWKSLLMTGTFTYDHATKKGELELNGKETAKTLVSEFSRGGRGMELSELVTYNGKLYTVDDRTGIVFDISEGKAVPWAILADGDGKASTGFKGEWMTVKDDVLYVGGHGRQEISWDGKNTVMKHFLWVKTLNTEGGVKHHNWESNYDALRKAAGCESGYLTHEACVWSKVHKQWFFLPRKVSEEPYNYKLDEKKAGNILLRCSDNFTDISVTKIGELKYNTRGYSTFKFVPGTNDSLIIAIKSEEIGDAQKSFLTVFTIDGEVLIDDEEFSYTMKYEGIEFI